MEALCRDCWGSSMLLFHRGGVSGDVVGTGDKCGGGGDPWGVGWVGGVTWTAGGDKRSGRSEISGPSASAGLSGKLANHSITSGRRLCGAGDSDRCRECDAGMPWKLVDADEVSCPRSASRGRLYRVLADTGGERSPPGGGLGVEAGAAHVGRLGVIDVRSGV